MQLLLWGQAAEGLLLGFGRTRGRFPAQFSQLCVALVGELQALQHVTELQPVGLKPVASGQFFVDLREPQPVHLQGLQQGRTHLAPLHRDAQLVAQIAHGAEVALQHQLALITGGAPGDLRCDRWVAIAVGAHPGAEGAEPVFRRCHIGVGVLQRLADAFVQQGHRLEQHLLEEVQGVIHLIEHRWFELVQLIGAPPNADLFKQLLAQPLTIIKAVVFVIQPLQALNEMGHAAVLGAHGVANYFRGVGGEHQPHIQLPQQGLEQPGGHIQGAQPLEQPLEGGGLVVVGEVAIEGVADGGFSDVVLAHRGQVAVFLDVLLEDVDQLEIEGEGPGGRDGLREIHRHDQVDDLIGGFVFAAELLELQHPLGLLRRAFAAQHVAPQLFDQLQALVQLTQGAATDGLNSLGLRSRHARGRSSGRRFDHPKPPSSKSCSRASMAAISALRMAEMLSPLWWRCSHCMAVLPCSSSAGRRSSQARAGCWSPQALRSWSCSWIHCRALMGRPSRQWRNSASRLEAAAC